MLCSPASLTAELESWLAKLDAFHTFIMTSDLPVPSALSPSTYSCVCYLTSLCAEMEIYNHTQSTQATPTSLTTPTSSEDTSPTCETTPTQDITPSSLVSFIQRYVKYLDHKRLLRLLCLKDWPTRRQCWACLSEVTPFEQPTTTPSSPVNKEWSTTLFQYVMSGNHHSSSSSSSSPSSLVQSLPPNPPPPLALALVPLAPLVLPLAPLALPLAPLAPLALPLSHPTF